ncbi:YitT family protein [Aquibacillus sp. 3ASR75-11]|uniref:YitT family protein n=1 Tax=Terrihalobacillus insolitus TaxID=2950438 RepID=A0A9X4ANB1_9BACI|nr:YitT family protein [Terrihalobacillus insolitus]MDC3415220.1 YitT family protein [Terrihalobacillus insolitus]MDC3426236.1 YitT family protein [Terrihalobacillus insolitus]
MRYTNKAFMLVACGGFIQGMAMALFLFPHSIPSGGAGGIAVLLNYWFDIPLSFALWFVNFTLLVAAIYWLGNASAIGTMFGITITSISIHLFEIEMPLSITNVWFDVIVGSMILGLGIGILLRQGVSNGGMGVIALIVATQRKIAPGRPLLILNGCIFLLTGSIIDWRIVILAVFSQWISTRVVDIVYHFKMQPIFPPVIHWRKK